MVEHLPPMQASHQCGPGSIPGLGVICGLSLLLVLVLAPRGFSPGTPVFPSPQKPTFPNSNSIWNPEGHKFISLGLLRATLVKQTIYLFIYYSVKTLQSFITELSLVDAWRVLNHDISRYTWRRKNPEIQCRLDFLS